MSFSRISRQLELDSIIEIAYKPLNEKGEDSFAYNFENGSLHFQAVYDGCGGSGSWQYEEYKNATGAFIAAQSMARASLDWFGSLSPDMLKDTGEIAESFHNAAKSVLKELKAQCKPMLISGSLVKSFPCTASASIMKQDGNKLSQTILNVGDSRVYCLTPQRGIVQLTVDDSQDNPDPLESLRESAPLSDMLNADTDFIVKVGQITLDYPCAIITATDGVFGYFRSPMDFEYYFLDALMKSGSFDQFEKNLKETIIQSTGDDSTCIVSFYGWGSFENVKRLLAERYNYTMSIMSFLEKAMANGNIDIALETVWKDYKKQAMFEPQ